MRNRRYKPHEKTLASASKISSYFKKTMPHNDNFISAVTEGASTCQSFNHDFSFRSKHDYSQLILLNLIPIFLFVCLSMKSEFVAIKVLMPLPEELHN